MDPNGNLSISERRALRHGDWVVFQTEATAHRGEQRGRVHHVGESGIVWLGTTGSRYALSTDYVARADWPRADAPGPAIGVAVPETGKDAGETPDAPEGQEMTSGDVTDPETGLLMAPAIKGVIDDLRAQVKALTSERDEARRQLRWWRCWHGI